MKGFEITCKGKKTILAVKESLSISIMINKTDTGLYYNILGDDTDLFYQWDYAELSMGDEIVIKQTDVEKGTEPTYSEQMRFEPKEKLLQGALEKFRKLECKLRANGVIE